MAEPDQSPVKVGDWVVVLNSRMDPHTVGRIGVVLVGTRGERCTVGVRVGDGSCWGSGGYFGEWTHVHAWRLATPEELARYQLDQLGQENAL